MLVVVFGLPEMGLERSNEPLFAMRGNLRYGSCTVYLYLPMPRQDGDTMRCMLHLSSLDLAVRGGSR